MGLTCEYSSHLVVELVALYDDKNLVWWLITWDFITIFFYTVNIIITNQYLY